MQLLERNKMPTDTVTTDVSVVIPVYGGEHTLPNLVLELHRVAETAGWQVEVILVCDAPHDGSWATAAALAQNHSGVRAFLLKRNYGQHAATLLGIREARGQTVVTMDEDLQHSPLDLPMLVDASLVGEGLVYGVSHAAPHGLWRGVGSKLAKWLLWSVVYTRLGAPPPTSSFRAFPGNATTKLNGPTEHPVVVDAMLYRTGISVGHVFCHHQQRHVGNSGYNPWKLWRHFVHLALASWLTAPNNPRALRQGTVATVAGIVSMAGGFGAWTLLVDPAPNASVATKMVGVACAILATLGAGMLIETTRMVGATLLRLPHYRVRARSDALDDQATQENQLPLTAKQVQS